MTRLHPLSAVTRVLSYGINGLSIPVFAGLVGGSILSEVSGSPFGDAAIDALFVAAPIGLAIGATYGYLTYRRFSYELTDDTFDVGSGVVGRTEREIPLRRIQNVDIQQNILHRIFDVAVVRIETAGGGNTEAVLSVVDVDEARRLQQGIRERRAALDRTENARAGQGSTTPTDAAAAEDSASPIDTGVEGQPEPGSVGEAGEPGGRGDAAEPGPGHETGEPTETGGTGETGSPGESGRPEETAGGWGEPEPEPEPLVTLKFTDLLVLAVTNFKIGSLVFLLFGAPLLGDLATDVLIAAAAPLGGPESLDFREMTADQFFILGGVAGPIVAVAGYALSAVVAVQGYYGFELARRGDDLVYERGLLQRFSGSIPTDKIQTLTVTETAPMRWLGYAGLAVETAGYGGGGGDAGSQAAVPLASAGRVRELGHELFDFEDYAVERPPKRARQRYTFRYGIVVVAVVATAYAAALTFEGFTLWWVTSFLFPFVPLAGHLKWKHRGYALGEDHVFVRSGFWRRRTQVIPYYRLQTVVSEATVFQRRRGLASLIADTASSATLSRSAPTAHDLDAETVDMLQQELRDRLQQHLVGDGRKH